MPWYNTFKKDFTDSFLVFSSLKRGIIYLMWTLHRVFRLCSCPWGGRGLADVRYSHGALSSRVSESEFAELRARSIFMGGVRARHWALPLVCAPSFRSHNSDRIITLALGTRKPQLGSLPLFLRLNNVYKQSALNPDLPGSKVGALLCTLAEKGVSQLSEYFHYCR